MNKNKACIPEYKIINISHSSIGIEEFNEEMREHWFSGVFSDDEEGAAAIRSVFESDRYLMDTHTSIAWACMEKYRSGNDAVPTVVLSTASPYKFSAAVLEALGEELTGSDEGNMQKVRDITGAEVPSGLAGIFSRPVVHKDVIDISDMKSYVIEKCTR